MQAGMGNILRGSGIPNQTAKHYYLFKKIGTHNQGGFS
jgi:hypothetical protein